MKYSQFPDIEIPKFLQSPEWKDTSYHNNETASSELTYPDDFGYHLIVWVWADGIHDRGAKFTIWTTSDEDSEPLEEDEAQTEAEALQIIAAHKWVLDFMLENHINRDNPNYEGPTGVQPS